MSQARCQNFRDHTLSIHQKIINYVLGRVNRNLIALDVAHRSLCTTYLIFCITVAIFFCALQQPYMSMQTLAERLIWARTRRNWSQSQLADVAGVSQGTIANLENGVSLTARKIVAIAAALDVSSAWLAEGRGEVNASEDTLRQEAQGHSLQWVTDSESVYLSLLRNLSPDAKDTVMSMMRVLQNAGAAQDAARK